MSGEDLASTIILAFSIRIHPAFGFIRGARTIWPVNQIETRLSHH